MRSDVERFVGGTAVRPPTSDAGCNRSTGGEQFGHPNSAWPDHQSGRRLRFVDQRTRGARDVYVRALTAPVRTACVDGGLAIWLDQNRQTD